MCRCRLILVLGIIAAWLSAARAETASPQDQAARAKPLNHTVRVQRMGRMLKLDYALVGADGREYNLWDLGGSGNPTFAIYQGDVQVSRGTFERG